MGSGLVISFFNKGKPFSRVCLFFNFVRNRIYVMEVEMLELVFTGKIFVIFLPSLTPIFSQTL
jgi:hypothetical protein